MFGGTNAEAYFSSDGTKLIYQATPPGAVCDQEYVLDLKSGESKRVSSGKGRTTWRIIEQLLCNLAAVAYSGETE